MDASNPYEPPRSSSDDATEPSVSNPLLAELTRGRPWALAAGVSIAVAGVAMLAVILASEAASETSTIPTLGFLCGCGLLSARLLILARTLREAATPPHRIDLCFRDIRKVFSHPGVIVVAFLGVFLVALLFIVGSLALPGEAVGRVLDDLRRTRIWLYIISAFCVVFLLAGGYSRLSVVAQIVCATLVIPPLLVMVSIARNIRRYERGDEPALLVVVRGLRALWIVLMLTSTLSIASIALAFAYRYLRL